MFPILKQMGDGKEYKRIEMFEVLKQNFTQEELTETLKSGHSKLLDRVGWAFTFLTKAEFIEKSLSRKASYFITELGKNALNDGLKGIVINEDYLKTTSPNYLKNWEVVKVSNKPEIIDSKNDEDVNDGEDFNLEEAIEELRQETEIEFIKTLRNLDWKFFEDFCAELVEKMGYGVGELRERRVRDGGIDGVIYTDELGIKDKIYIQAKRYGEGNNVTSKDVQAFLHIATKAKSKGIFITTSKFSSDAKEVAKDDERNGSIALIDNVKLIKLCIKYKHGFKLKKIIELLEVDL